LRIRSELRTIDVDISSTLYLPKEDVMRFGQVRKRPIARSSLAWVTAALAAIVGTWTWTSTSHATAVAASSRVFRETGNLHKTAKNGASFTEQGPASGTNKGTLTLYLTTTAKGVTFRVSGKLPGGSLTGYGSATIESEGKIGKVVGKAAFTGGSGRYAHAHGTGFKVTGTFNRETYALRVTLDGHLSS
jgi:hypothetical protein